MRRFKTTLIAAVVAVCFSFGFAVSPVTGYAEEVVEVPPVVEEVIPETPETEIPPAEELPPVEEETKPSTFDEFLQWTEMEAEKYGHLDRIFYFSSTSKITFPGAGVAIEAGSPNNVAILKGRMKFQTIGPDKLNQLRHARMFKNANELYKHMKGHAALLRPKFESVLNELESRIAGTGIARWTNPKGGYFISLYVLEGCAKRTEDAALGCSHVSCHIDGKGTGGGLTDRHKVDHRLLGNNMSPAKAHLLLDHRQHSITAAKGNSADHKEASKQFQKDHFAALLSIIREVTRPKMAQPMITKRMLMSKKVLTTNAPPITT